MAPRGSNLSRVELGLHNLAIYLEPRSYFVGSELVSDEILSGSTMRLIRGLHNLQSALSACVATIGNFDGLHLGHQEILVQLKAQAKRLGLPTCVILFEPQPREFFDPQGSLARLDNFRDKLAKLQAEGIDQVVCIRFDESLRALTAQQFVTQILVDGIGIRYLVVGDDFRFGNDRGGDFEMLQRAGREQGFEVSHAQTLSHSGERVSSTLIRRLLLESRFDAAETLLGRPYAISGRVVYGQQLGRQLGVPTANIHLKRKVAPLNGVYRVLFCREDGSRHAGVANIGMRPTVEGKRAVLEVHLLDFSGHLYAEHVVVKFVDKLREEMKFESLEALKEAIHGDLHEARKRFAEQITQH